MRRFPASPADALSVFGAHLHPAFLEWRRGQLEEYFKAVLQFRPIELLHFLKAREGTHDDLAGRVRAALGLSSVAAKALQQECAEADVPLPAADDKPTPGDQEPLHAASAPHDEQEASFSAQPTGDETFGGTAATATAAAATAGTFGVEPPVAASGETGSLPPAPLTPCNSESEASGDESSEASPQLEAVEGAAEALEPAAEPSWLEEATKHLEQLSSPFGVSADEMAAQPFDTPLTPRTTLELEDASGEEPPTPARRLPVALSPRLESVLTSCGCLDVAPLLLEQQIVHTATLAWLDVEAAAKASGLPMGSAADLLAAARAAHGQPSGGGRSSTFWYKTAVVVGLLAIGTQLWLLHHLMELSGSLV